MTVVHGSAICRQCAVLQAEGVWLRRETSLTVELQIDYGDGVGFHRFRSYDSITSPDEDGDHDIDPVDQALFLSAYMLLNVYKADMDGNGVVNVKDYDWFVAHRTAQ